MNRKITITVAVLELLLLGVAFYALSFLIVSHAIPHQPRVDNQRSEYRYQHIDADLQRLAEWVDRLEAAE